MEMETPMVKLSVSRRTALQLLLSGTGVAVLMACGAIPQAGGGAPAAQPTSGGAPVAAGPAPATPAIQPKSGGTWNIWNGTGTAVSMRVSLSVASPLPSALQSQTNRHAE